MPQHEYFFSCKRIYVNGTRLVIATGVPSVHTTPVEHNPSRPVLAVAIELVDYEAYKGFPYVSNRDMTDMNRFYVKRQINVYSNSSIRRECPCFPLLIEGQGSISN